MKKTIDFLKKLRDDNNREWFEEHRNLYEESEKDVKQLASTVAEMIGSHDELDPSGTKIFRIYRDVRFSKNKAPYKPQRSMSFTRAGEERRGGYYLHLEPGNCFLATGFWEPESADLLHVRKQISQDPEPLRDLMKSKEFQSYFGEIRGDQVKTAPKGFSREDPAIDLIRYKKFILVHNFTDSEVQQPDFPKTVSDGFLKARPFLNYFTEILTTDLNGVPLLNKH